MPQRFSDDDIERMKEMHRSGYSWQQIADEFDTTKEIARDTCRRRGGYKHARPSNNTTPSETRRPERVFKENKEKNEATLDVITTAPVKTEKDAIRVAEVDLSIWYVHSWECRMWTTPLKLDGGQETVKVGEKEVLRWRPAKASQQQQYLVALKLRRKSPEILSLESLLDEISKCGKIKLPVYKRKPIGTHRRALEISIMDPHLGLRCFQPAADMAWSPEEAEQAFMETVEQLLRQAKLYGPFEEIACPIGNDYFHSDNLFHTTTAGTHQPESDSHLDVTNRGEHLLTWFAERLRREAPVKMFSIPGNHDRLTSHFMARILRAYYRGAEATDVEVDASSSPYKFWRYGVNLIGFEHGHSVNAIRLAALMANETRLTHWQEARYCEWHLGDQHRKGSAKPSTFEEQGVSVEYLPSLTPANEWHRLKGFNWQKRGAMAFVYDFHAGPIARLQCNFDSYTGKHLGAS